MKETEPKIRLLAYTAVDWREMVEYVKSVGGERWTKRMAFSGLSEPEVLVEFNGRLCYRSWDVGLNKNVTKVREDSHEYFTNLLKSGHGSVLEHANFTFLFQDVSRVFTHELVRHRAGVAISQESLRYVRLTDIGFRIPPALEDAVGRRTIIELIERMEEVQLAGGRMLDAESLPFAVKKEVTSALRRIAPLGLSTSIVWTANARTLRHVISMRTAAGAEEEIRLVFRQVAAMLIDRHPFLFGDFQEDEKGAYITPYWKV